ncbi:hypothetical protein BJY04DRAFT_178855 [Aspergillus karnatakaensis]|uniref:uncharacterized protein n=1 Tax=Aspergillus karnatakaensis TaxID=1810916 RepID=UPI003CCDCFDD
MSRATRDSPVVFVGLLVVIVVHFMLQNALWTNEIQDPGTGAQYSGKVTYTKLNVDRCAELHNAIVQEVAHAPGFENANVTKYTDSWAAHQDENLKGLRRSIGSPLYDFLSKADLIVGAPWAHMTPHVGGLAAPSSLSEEDFPLFFDEYNKCVTLYSSNEDADEAVGLVFDLNTNKATWIDDYFFTPPRYMDHVWVPLEEILEAWLSHIRRRCIAHPGSYDDAFWGQAYGWRLRYPPKEDVEEDLRLWDKYVALVESKLPKKPQAATVNNADDVPEFLGFPEEFLSRARKPQFKYVAPGLVFPSMSQMEELAQRQLELFGADKDSWRRPVSEKVAEHDEESAMEKDDSPGMELLDINEDWRPSTEVPTVLFPLGDNIHAGLCTGGDNEWQDGVGLILPSSKGYKRWIGPPADYSPYSRSQLPRFERVWQVKTMSPYWRSHHPRLARVLEKWIQLVQDGTWKVGKEGIKGKLENYLEEEISTDSWEDQDTRPVGMLLDGVDGS